MNEKIQEAIDYMEKMEWIKVNERLNRELLTVTIREYIAKASFRDIMDFFNRP